MEITGAELLVKALQKEKVEVLFAYPGGQAIDLFDAVYGQEGIDVILPRHEQGLIHAADGYARSTGKVGVCLVTSGPGATNLVTGIATANYDSVPLVCFTGQVPTNLMGNNAFQEVDIVSITRSITKYAITVRERKDLAAIIKKAFIIASTGKPGVVVVDLPKDIQQAYGSDEYAAQIDLGSDQPDVSMNMEQLNIILEKVKKSQQPIFLIGGGVNIAGANKEMTQLAEKTGIPVITTMMGKGGIPTDHDLYIGNLGIHGSYAANAAISQCDLLFAIGTRFSDRIIGKVSEFAKYAEIIHLDIDPTSISRDVVPHVSVAADAKTAILALLEHAEKSSVAPWVGQIKTWQQTFPLSMKGAHMTPQRIIEKINERVEQAIIVTDVGQNQLWATQFLALNEHKQMLTSGGLGTMGYGFPAAIGAKIGNPDKDVIVISGDGGMQMNIQEMATAVVYELPIIICIFNNGYLGNVRQWQEMFFHQRYASTCTRYRKSCPPLCNTSNRDCPEYTPDFIRLAESYGAKGIRVEQTADIAPALGRAKENTKTPTIIEFIIGREENVLPIVRPGSPLSEMIMESGEQ